MKTSDIKIAFVLILNAALAILSLTCCEKNNKDKMLWSVASQSHHNVEISFDPNRRPQIEIIAPAEGGECQIYCPNYEHVSFRDRNLKANVHMDFVCQFHAEVTAPGVITIKFDKVEHDNDKLSSYFMIDGMDGKDISATVVKVTRKFKNTEQPKAYALSNNLASLSY